MDEFVNFFKITDGDDVIALSRVDADNKARYFIKPPPNQNFIEVTDQEFITYMKSTKAYWELLYDPE